MASSKKERVEAKINEAREKTMAAIVELMESKGLMWVQEWENYFGTDGTMPRNGITNRWYAGGNTMHLMVCAMANGWSDPRWFTEKQAKGIGYHLDERFDRYDDCAVVEYYKRFRGMLDKDGNITHDPDECERTFSYVRPVSWFRLYNAEQFVNEDGEPMPAPEKQSETVVAGSFDVADRLIETSRCPIRERKGGMKACYRPIEDNIEIPHRVQFTGVESFTSTLAHEMAHSTMKPLHRDALSAFGSTDYAFEELVAELGSTFVCMELGIHRTAELECDESFKNHAAYLKSWLQKFGENKDYLFKAASKAARAATYIVERYYGKEEAEDKAA